MSVDVMKLNAKRKHNDVSEDKSHGLLLKPIRQNRYGHTKAMITAWVTAH